MPTHVEGLLRGLIPAEAPAAWAPAERCRLHPTGRMDSEISGGSRLVLRCESAHAHI